MTESPNPAPNRGNGCLKAILISLLVFLLLGGATVLIVRSALTSFGLFRDKLGLRQELVVSGERARYSPGFDGVMWCRFNTTAKTLDEVFDPSRVDASEFDSSGFRFKEDWIKDEWWDPDDRPLTGGEVELDGNYLRAAWTDNGDGTRTVYIFWFEV